MGKKKPNTDSPPLSESSAQPANEGGRQNTDTTAGADANASDTDVLREQGEAEGAAQASAAPGAKAPDAHVEAQGPAHVDLAAKLAQLPAMPPEVRATVSLVVKAKVPSRRRAGRSFGRDETVIPLATISDAEVAAIEGDPVLTTAFRVPAPKR
jgi:hypothetical protein